MSHAVTVGDILVVGGILIVVCVILYLVLRIAAAYNSDV